MIQLKTMREFNSSNITAKDACRIFSSSKPYLVKVEDDAIVELGRYLLDNMELDKDTISW